MLITYQFFLLSLSLSPCFAPTNVPLPSIFKKLVGMTLPFTLTLTVLLQRKETSISLQKDSEDQSKRQSEYSSLSSAAALFTSLTLNATKSSIPFGGIKRHPKAWWSAEVEEAVNEKRKALNFGCRSRRIPITLVKDLSFNPFAIESSTLTI